jgi:hypothetical protein
MRKNSMGNPCLGPTLAEVEKIMVQTSFGGGPTYVQRTNS